MVARRVFPSCVFRESGIFPQYRTAPIAPPTPLWVTLPCLRWHPAESVACSGLDSVPGDLPFPLSCFPHCNSLTQVSLQARVTAALATVSPSCSLKKNRHGLPGMISHRLRFKAHHQHLDAPGVSPQRTQTIRRPLANDPLHYYITYPSAFRPCTDGSRLSGFH